MNRFLIITALIAQCALGASALAGESCAKPEPLFGKIIATCGDQMILYVGDQKLNVLGVATTRSEFELAYCKSGGGRKPLNLQTNSEGYTFTSETYVRDNIAENYRISRMWGDFEMAGTDWYGKPVKVKCAPYEDKRTNIDYIN